MKFYIFIITAICAVYNAEMLRNIMDMKLQLLIYKITIKI